MQSIILKNQTHCVQAQPEAAADWLIQIVSRNPLQSSLLNAYLEKNLSVRCTVHTPDDWHVPDERKEAENTLILMDCFGIDPPDIWMKLALGAGPEPRMQNLALFNITPSAGSGFERQAIENKVRGVFYTNDPPGRLLKGIEKILNGEIWFSRRTTSEMLMEAHYQHIDMESVEAMLTAREKEIMLAIASGASNSDIAAAFCISLHTVKTHLYNIYKKIDVNNRLEATLWVARYL